MEIDLGLFRRNAKISTTISAVSIAIPFALGAAVAVGVYRHFIDPSKSFGVFILFVGTAL
jgi:Kef-type K+ transport system membrane component KefB